MIREGQGESKLGEGDIQKKGRVQVVEHPNLPKKKNLKRMLCLLTVTILERVNDSIFFQSNTFTACKVKVEKEVTNSLMVDNLLNIIHPFQGKKHLKT